MMRLYAKARCVLPVLICPVLETLKAPLTATSSTGEWTVAAGGPRDIRGCANLRNIIENDEALGFIDFAPTLEIPADLEINQDILTIDGVAICDTVLVAQDAAGVWHFSDDAGEDLNPRLTFAAQDFAGLKIWFGSYDIARCEGSLRLGQQSATLCPDL